VASWSDVVIAAPELATAVQARFDATHTGAPPPPGPFHLFRADVVELSIVRPAGDHLDIDSWREGGHAKRVERF
jgi:hypothetical protein